MKTHFTFCLCALMPWCLPAAEPPSAPILRNEAGMHTAKIGRISTDRAGRLALTASLDKTARLWALPDPKTPCREGRRSGHQQRDQ
jgi:hypothetical protein